MILGNDISSYQGDVDFDIYKNNSNFVIIKATEGIGFVDPKLQRNQSEARRVGLPLGYYAFARPSYGNDPAQEADYFLSKVGQLQEGEVLVLDFEDAYTGDPAVAWCKNWLDRVKFMTGVKPLIYLNQSHMSWNWLPVVLADYALWIAAYTYDPNNNNFNNGQWSGAAMQQWTNQQNVPGIVGSVDGDVFFGDITAFKSYGYHKPTPPPPPPVQPIVTTTFENIKTDTTGYVSISNSVALHTYTDKDIIFDLGFIRVIKV